MLLNHLYNFKNPIRHFFNLDKLLFDQPHTCRFEDLDWTTPVKFKIFKTDDAQRVISFPNLLNFYHAVSLFQQEENFEQIPSMSGKKRVCPDLHTGDFSVLSYYHALQRDVFRLTQYDKLLILDIKSFYGRIYTHDLSFKNQTDKLEQRITSLNRGRTNGLLLGSYLSLYLAEKFLVKIENDLEQALRQHQIQCHFEYFSDDFYFFCNRGDIQKITEIFTSVLDEYDLQVNHEKTTIEDFETYTKKNNLEKLWKKIINLSVEKDKEIDKRRARDPEATDYPIFFTQLVYRLSQISELKYKRIFLANFFKTQYFYQLDPSRYTLSESDLNYICYIYKLMPETILYSLPKIKKMRGFHMPKFKEFLLSRFRAVLQTERQEEQVYFFYAIYLCGLRPDGNTWRDLVLHSKNQILVSYWIMEGLIDPTSIELYGESFWLQNYHYLWKIGTERIDILLPSARSRGRQGSYRAFYENNLNAHIPILKPLKEIDAGIRNYIKAKIESYSAI